MSSDLSPKEFEGTIAEKKLDLAWEQVKYWQKKLEEIEKSD